MLDQAPSQKAWRSLIELFDSWSEKEELEVGLDYARAHLDEHWPPSLRKAPIMWVDVLLGGKKNEASQRKWLRGERAHPGLMLSRTLDFKSNKLTAKKLAECKKTKHLQQIDHIASRVLDAGAITTLSSLSPMKHIDFSGSSLGEEGLCALLKWDLRQVETLLLRDCGLTDAALTQLFSMELPALGHLDLSENPLGEKGFEALVGAALPTLHKLQLASTSLDDEQLKTFCTLHSPSLKTLDLSFNDLGGESLSAIVSMGSQLPALETLSLQGLSITPNDAKALAALSFPHLRKLFFGYNQLQDEGVQVLCSIKLPKTLEQLNLKDNQITAESTKEFTKWTQSTELKGLDLRWNHFTRDDNKALQQALTHIPELTLGYEV